MKSAGPVGWVGESPPPSLGRPGGLVSTCKGVAQLDPSGKGVSHPGTASLDPPVVRAPFPPPSLLVQVAPEPPRRRGGAP